MARVSTYLNFGRNTEQVFEFYRSVFGGEFTVDISRMGDATPAENMPEISDEDKKLVMHVELPILGGHVLMGTDAPESMGFSLTFGNNQYINLEPDTREETRKIFTALSHEGNIESELQEMIWGGYYGAVTDKFGVRWMVNCNAK